ncbi:Molybdenum transport system permease protein ModB [Dickeya dianthicola]|uniref:Iron ABC transporter permease n=1 Tax=Dickeya dianthicola TaxID=204039 RepID=A0AAP6VFA6_9GAMM|nr:ABC transporter permease subunit [Dickeya dianthicola]AYC20218.1 Molybdenum transport system permease protein ModB [Dickeya dianthicola]MBI0438697.1 iron ABC transporter permease [Dickeya dianthicola]MBI0453457.1 iron ABC transporter permease [Dickeya dianthicola]MBI0462549.1 iron ABC transporter permease [Dickeya dianthicola]MBI0466992.1 iron ABC transporter permease [Dickeya dianthicola]
MTSGIWRISSVLLAGMLLFPLVTIVGMALSAPGDAVSALWHVLPVYGMNSLMLVAGCVLFSLLFALPLAWLMSRYRFAGQVWLHRALLLPLAMPGYLLAAVYGDALGYEGPVKQTLYALSFDMDIVPQTFWQQALMVACASLCLALVLFPYVYLIVRTALMSQPVSLQQAARLMNQTRAQAFWRVVFPMTRPAIALGMVLMASEALGDYGISAYFSLQTITTAGLDLWRDKAQHGTAALLMSLLLPLVFLVWFQGRRSRARQLRYQKSSGVCPQSQPVLRGWPLFLTILFGGALVVIAFVVPVGRLVCWAILSEAPTWSLPFLLAFTSSFVAATCATLLVIGLAVVCMFDFRAIGNPAYRNPLRWLNLNRLLPSTALGMGLLVPFLGGDAWRAAAGGVVDDPWAGSVLVLILAYCMRFSGLLIDRLQIRMSRLSGAMTHVSQSLGYTPALQVLWVYLPQLSHCLIVGVLLVFTESLRELNASLLLQPFEVETMATYVFRFMMDERLPLVASPALMLVGVGMIPLFGITRLMRMEG